MKVVIIDGQGGGMGRALVERLRAARPDQPVLCVGTNALATAASLAVFETFDRDKILDNVKEMGAYLRGKLEKLAEKYDFVKEVRGRGLMLGIVLDFPAKDILPVLREKGLIALSAGEVVLRLLPPLIVKREDCDKAVRIIGAAFKEYSASKGGRK